MENAFKLIDMAKTMNNIKIEIKNLYKIFGAKDKSFVDSIKNGMSKQELLDQHNHVLGLDNINLAIPEKKNSGHYGSFRFW